MNIQSALNDSDECPSPSLASLLCTLIGLTACGNNVNVLDAPQIVALVNGRPVTAWQLQQAIRSGDPNAPLSPTQALESLVDRELLAQAAEKRHLEADPEVAQALEGARRQILARAFAERDLDLQQPIPAIQARGFYMDNSLLFAAPKRFQLKSFTFREAKLSGRLSSQLAGIRSDAALVELLNNNDIEYTVQYRTLATDQLPMVELGEFAQASVGDVLTERLGNGNAVLTVIVGIDEEKAISFERANPYIESYLAKLRDQEAIKSYLEGARSVAKISYPASPGGLGTDFSDEAQSVRKLVGVRAP